MGLPKVVVVEVVQSIRNRCQGLVVVLVEVIVDEIDVDWVKSVEEREGFEDRGDFRGIADSRMQSFPGLFLCFSERSGVPWVVAVDKGVVVGEFEVKRAGDLHGGEEVGLEEVFDELKGRRNEGQ